MAVALGANLGDRMGGLRRGARGLQRLLEDVECSSVYDTAPRHRVDQPRFLNACCIGHTTLTARQLLTELQHLESLAGRISEGPRYGPRRLDLDLLLYGDAVIEYPGLEVPHPRMRERAFVLIPLAELCPDWEVPASGGAAASTVAELAVRVGGADVQRTNIDWG